jgi:ribosomal protein L3 glutamine methyltransferase
LTTPHHTLAGLVRAGTRALRRAPLAFGHGYGTAQDEATLLTLHALGLAPDTPLDGRKISVVGAARARALIETRISTRKPAAYLTHEAWLAGIRFFTDERVIVPRSYIAELLADDDLLLPPASEAHHALDLCTGSGCLAILLAKRYRKARIDATDISRDALAVAAVNVRRHRLTKRIKLLFSNVFSSLRGKRYELIISNPPYVRSAAMRRLPAEYRHEPALALASGEDGLDCIREILRNAAHHLTPGGVLVVECGHARERVERAWPRLPFLWPDTSGGDDCVFVLRREDLVSGLRRGSGSGRAPRPGLTVGLATPSTQRSRRRT